MPVSFKVQHLQHLFRHVFTTGMTAGLFQSDGTPLFVRYTHLADLGTLPLAARMTNQYLQLRPKQIAIMNDPYSGGTLLSTLTLIMGVNLSDRAGDKAEFLIAYRFPLRPHLTFASKVDEEGLRIPPTPVFENGLLNNQLLQIMSEHPLCPSGFLPKTQEGILAIQQLGHNLKRAFQIHSLNPSKALIQNYLAISNQQIKQQLSDLPIGDVTIQSTVDHESRIRLHVELTGEKVLVDFTGTTDSKTIHMTDAATFGACFGALTTVIDQNMPVTGGAFQVLEVRTPSGTMLNAKYPAPTFIGMSEGVNLTASLMLRALGQLIPTKLAAITPPTPVTLDIEFEDGKHFFDTVSPGVAGSRERDGELGLTFWNRSPLQASIEDIETRFSLRIRSIAHRPSSGGKGVKKGGDGLVKIFELTAPAKMKWSLGPQIKLEGVEGGAPGSESEIFLQKKSGKKEKLAPTGESRLENGDLIFIHSAGGGGYGHGK